MGLELLDKQLEYGLQGNFKEGWRLSEELIENFPKNNRVLFNRGWYLLRQGKLLEGHKLLDYGRYEKVFGNGYIQTPQPIWRKEAGTVLLNLEGGFGDQIKSYRYAYDIENLGNKVVVACSPELVEIFSKKFITVTHNVVSGVYHDYWLPSMSAVIPLEYEYKDLKGEPYISRTADTIPGRIGIRWNGNPKFEHEQYRLFPSNLMFDAVKKYDCVSLQRDEGEEARPKWMKKVDLSTWISTQREISKCELIITSCTSVAHLAGAMGIETWVIVPVLSYYLWALPGKKSPYYDSVTLYRQKKYRDWTSPFKSIKQDLKMRY